MSNKEKLVPVDLPALAELIRYPEGKTLSIIERMQKVMPINNNAAMQLKLELPYYIGAKFEGDIRNSNNFLHISWFTLDLDHCFSTIREEEELKDKLKADHRIVLLYTSPSNTGLKILFRLKEQIGHTKLFSDFYLSFARDFSTAHGIEKYVDFKTHDVTRVSFLGSDPMLYLNPSATPVDPTSYSGLFDPSQAHSFEQGTAGGENPEATDTPNGKQVLNDDIYKDILRKINPATPARKKQYFVPSALGSITSPLSAVVSAFGIEMEEATDIQYGRKYRFRHGEARAEINIYYGKNGFSVVKSPKNGTLPELNEIVYRLALTVIDNLVHNRDATKVAGKLNKNHEN